MTGAKSINELLKIRNEVNEVLISGSSELRKWFSTDNKLLQDISKNSENMVLHLDKNETLKTLGLLWNAHEDVLLYYTRN